MNVEDLLDEEQRAAAVVLQDVANGLRRGRARIGGAYLWGPVGRGKTWLMNSFFHSVPVPKRRVHFHDFFRNLNADAHRLGSIDSAISAVLGDIRLLCIDEFHLHDPGDAVLLARVLKSLFAQGVTMVVTSNYPPEGLLPSPLFHHLFEPSIALLEREMAVVRVAGPVDYRAVLPIPEGGAGFSAGRYLLEAEAEMVPPGAPLAIPVGRRTVAAVAAHEGAIWFGFPALCVNPTAPSDYIELAQRYSEWILVGVPRLGEGDPESVKRFANVVDVLYDRDIPLTLVAEVSLDELIVGPVQLPDLDRLVSRLSMLRRSCRLACPSSEPPDAVDIELGQGRKPHRYSSSVGIEHLSRTRVDPDV